MKILFVIPYVPSPVRVRSFQFIRHLSAQGHQVSLITLWTHQNEREQAERLKTVCEKVWAFQLPAWRSVMNVLAGLPGRDPFQSRYSWHPGLAEWLSALGQDQAPGPAFDVIHLEHLRGARYGDCLRRGPGMDGIPIVWDSVDCISMLFRMAGLHNPSPLSRWIARIELPRTERYEGQVQSHFNRVICTSPADRAGLLALAGEDQRPEDIQVIPNGVDLEYFRPDPGIRRDPATLVISGKMSYHANVAMVNHFYHNVLPRIWAFRPDVRLVVVGQDPPGEIRRLADASRVQVTGTVEDIRPYLTRATLALAPILYGVGIQNKVLEAMACATPTICSPQAVSAVKAEAGKEVFVAKDAEEMARTILDLLDDPERLRQAGWAGRRYVEIHHRWGEMTNVLAQVYDSAIVSRNHRKGSTPNRERIMEWK
jgi:polysaccharide biosynthesis protein PslH